MAFHEQREREIGERRLKQFLADGRYLPDVLKDFHDQKDIFKTMHHLSGWNEEEGWARNVSWMEGQIYVIDLFLHFMARHGYTLQRSRAKLAFHSLDEKLARFHKEQADALKGFLDATLARDAADPSAMPTRETGEKATGAGGENDV